MKLLHRYPDMLAKVRIDAGAIKFLLAVRTYVFVFSTPKLIQILGRWLLAALAWGLYLILLCTSHIARRTLHPHYLCFPLSNQFFFSSSPLLCLYYELNLQQGANMMAPGLLSAGGDLPPNLSAGQLVAIHAQGKQHACGIGRLTASSEEIKKAGKGVAVEVLTYIG